MADRAQRPFWIHQLVEYVIGIVLIALAFQDPDPGLPAVGGALVLVNASLVRGPFGAFKFVGRRQHRWMDVAVMALLIVGALQPWLPGSEVGRATLAMMCIPLGFLWWYTDWDERPARRDRRTATGRQQANDLGRTAGRLAGRGWKAAKGKIDNLNPPD